MCVRIYITAPSVPAAPAAPAAPTAAGMDVAGSIVAKNRAHSHTHIRGEDVARNHRTNRKIPENNTHSILHTR